MQILIEIEEETYNLVKSWNHPTDTAHKMLFELVTNGTPQPKIGHCEGCKHFRKLPYHADALGKCIQYTGFCPKGDWYCADYELQEGSDKE